MNQLCKVCGEPAAGFHFGAFTCEGCKSFFGRTYNNLSQIHECKNGGTCVINKQNRTSCKACRLKKCLCVGMSKSGSRYGRRSNWFKIHCLLQEQALQLNKGIEGGGGDQASLRSSPAQISLLSPGRTEDERKGETPTESISSEHSLESDRRGDLTPLIDTADCNFPKRDQKINGEPISGGDFVANFGLYTFHPSLSLLHASQLYSRFYPPSLYPGAAPPHLLIPPPFSPSRSPTEVLRLNQSHSPPITTSSPNSIKQSHPHSPYSTGSPETSPTHPPPPSPPLSLLGIASNPISPFIPRKRGAESPIAEPSSFRETSPIIEQAAPIDLRVKRRRLSTHSAPPGKVSNTPPPSPPLSIIQTSTMNATIIAPIDLTTKA